MFDILALVLITVAFPVIVLVGYKCLKGGVDKTKAGKAFALTLLFLELLRFFYNAKLYQGAITPAVDLKYSYVTLLTVVALFAAFHKGKFGALCKNVTVLTCLVPLVIGIFNPAVYTNALDTHAVIKGAYFVQSGVAVLLAILFLDGVPSVLHTLIAFAFVLFYAFLNFLANTYFKTGVAFDLGWFLQMGTAAVSCFVLYAVCFFVAKLSKKNTVKGE